MSADAYICAVLRGSADSRKTMILSLSRLFPLFQNDPHKMIVTGSNLDRSYPENMITCPSAVLKLLSSCSPDFREAKDSDVRMVLFIVCARCFPVLPRLQTCRYRISRFRRFTPVFLATFSTIALLGSFDPVVTFAQIIYYEYNRGILRWQDTFFRSTPRLVKRTLNRITSTQTYFMDKLYHYIGGITTHIAQTNRLVDICWEIILIGYSVRLHNLINCNFI